ncbi:F0F1 ATP synthase subunit B [Pygmaiobacter massiliensis]|uniref:F0F1 ATP synthase subunit B n=1 Tax=Pygmaiobacter massiliensis TaxID=1917873 RepID=UPI000C7E5102|nr:F0F1 ATP synthase subunit B [Pygmaiobacter massiliensis]
MLDIQPTTILWTVINLLILYFFFKKFLFGRVNNVLDQRAAMVKQQLSDSEQKQTEATQLREQYEQQLSQAQTQADQIIQRAKTQGDREYQALLQKAKQESSQLKADTLEQLDSERQTMLRQARGQVAALALSAAAKVSGKSLDASDDLALVESFLAEAGAEE